MEIVIDKESKSLGCDISKYQGKVDFFKMKKAGISFVIIRAGYGTTEDPNFKAYIDGASKAGLLIGVYWFIYANGGDKAKDNANKCLVVCEPYRDKLVLGIAADWEYHSEEKANIAITPALRTEIVDSFLLTVSNAGYFTGIYTNQDYIKSGKFEASLIARYPLWFAKDDDEKSAMTSYAMKGKGGYPYMHQFTSKGDGRKYGVSSQYIDLNRGYFRLIEESEPIPSNGITVNRFTPTKGNQTDWFKIIENLKKALNMTFGLSFQVNDIIDDSLLVNLANVELAEGNPLTDMNYVLQQALQWWGYSLKADGIFGSATARTIKTFQSQVGITQTSTTTPEFWRKLLGR